ncbi:Serine palmitoyltransferase 1 [Trichinella nativa]|uniref:Serine palmitoyltransferase 1 n=1 Tax=Trichinella nativa TaxID=6335 RepID=A0A0V1LIP0_9BILA|nr:Serine palmitoyltransferase 1 [Trichinella nativa]
MGDRPLYIAIPYLFFHLLRNIVNSICSAPFYHVCVEVALLICIVWLVTHKAYVISDSTDLTVTFFINGNYYQLCACIFEEKEELIIEWKPDLLVPLPEQCHLPEPHGPMIDSGLGKYVTIDGKEYLNFATQNFLGLATDFKIQDSAIAALHKYGVGACGPRGFYGTIDIHLDLEERLAEFMRCEEAVLYSYGFATISSAIPAYCKRGDVIFCDAGVNFAIQKGLQASRSRVEFFEHNNTRDLERLLKIQRRKDILACAVHSLCDWNPKKARVTRRFIVVEGIYLYYGDICPLVDLLKLKWKYKVRLFIDESISFGVLGAGGRGVTEHFGVDLDDVDMISSTLENAVSSIGGFTCGRSFVVDHQRLSGAGYCFSASMPPLLAAAAIRSLDLMQDEPERFQQLRKNSHQLFTALKRLRKFKVDGQRGSPIFHLRTKLAYMKSDLLDQLISKAN